MIKIFVNKYEFYDKDVNKYFLLLRKGIYRHKFMDSWERFSETSLPEKEDFKSNLNIKDSTDFVCKHAKKYGKALK